MTPQITTLSNGLRVLTAEMPGAYSATVSVQIGAGSRYEQRSVNGGVSHFLEHLLFKGTTKRPTTKIISEQVDAVGGWNNAYTSTELTNYLVKVPYQHTELGVDIIADMIRNSLFDADEIDRERNVVIEEMNVYQDDPASFVHRLTPKLLWPNHPLADPVLGNKKVIKGIKRDEIVAYRDQYYRPSNMVLSVAGRVKHECIVKLAERYFGDMEDKSTPKALPVTTTLDSKICTTLPKDTAQTHLVIGTIAYPIDHPNTPTARLIGTILGRGLSSRLFENVRERKGLAYSINAGVSSMVDTGEFEVYAGVNLDKTVDAINAIMEELQIISTQLVGDDELNKAKNQIRGGIEMGMESNTNVADRYGSQLLLLNKVRSVEDVMAEIDAVTPAKVKRVAAEMLDPKRLRLGIIAPDPKPAVAAFKKLQR
jgi:predicted Zn-dependent peptidase